MESVKIIDTRKENVKFKELEAGDFFYYSYTLYIRVKKCSVESRVFNCIMIETGEFVFFLSDCIVEPVSVEITVK